MDEKDFNIINLIGKGSFANVYKAVKYSDHNKKFVALKIIDRKKLNLILQKHVKFEIILLQKLNHPNIVKFYETFSNEDSIFISLEYCSGGNLQQYIRKHDKVSENSVQKIALQLFSILNELSIYNIVHRDIKPENLVIDPTLWKKNIPTIKLIDFGFACYLRDGEFTKTLCGSPLYLAPEVLSGNYYDSKVDIWSVGCVLFELMYGKSVFNAKSIKKLIEIIPSTIKQLNLHTSLTSITRQFILQMLIVNPVLRISIGEIMQSKFLKSILTPETERNDPFTVSVPLLNLCSSCPALLETKLETVKSFEDSFIRIENIEEEFELI